LDKNIENIERGVAGRLMEFISEKGLSVRQFSIECGLSNGLLSQFFSGTDMGISKLEKILSKYPDLDIAWLFTGKRNNEKIFSDISAQLESTFYKSPNNPPLSVNEHSELYDRKASGKDLRIHDLQIKNETLLEALAAVGKGKTKKQKKDGTV
jgi:transcriptional regulator with XRE-family HTH domain